MGLESDATGRHDFQPSVAPGLLQTEDYARAVLRGAPHAARAASPFTMLELADPADPTVADRGGGGRAGLTAGPYTHHGPEW